MALNWWSKEPTSSQQQSSSTTKFSFVQDEEETMYFKGSLAKFPAKCNAAASINGISPHLCKNSKSNSAPKDGHENQIQFALERGIGAMISAMSTKQLPFPTGSFEMIHCSRCRIDFHENDGILIKELGRLLRSNGYFVYSAPPACRKDKDFPVIWDKLVNLTTAMCWRLIAHKVQTAIWIKENSQPSCLLQNAKQKVINVCDVDDESKPSWNIPLKNCIQVRSSNTESYNLLHSTYLTLLE
ncbi:probable methyltransferase PMT6 [Lathyrus oleraceus]|uniref:probable methyltransferase PMT6 n=1 Tax=Pisum sativum TaxID=3888 RepID=UPI0021CDFA9E|nr:probable methyltransferase PMT6 [Pisum sativum]